MEVGAKQLDLPLSHSLCNLFCVCRLQRTLVPYFNRKWYDWLPLCITKQDIRCLSSVLGGIKIIYWAEAPKQFQWKYLLMEWSLGEHVETISDHSLFTCNFTWIPATVHVLLWYIQREDSIFFSLWNCWSLSASNFLSLHIPGSGTLLPVLFLWATVTILSIKRPHYRDIISRGTIYTF